MEITNVNEYEAIAKEKLPKMIYDYYASGAEDQWTLGENRNAFSRILFRPRILIDVTKIDMSTTILGEYATARAASAANTIMTLSSWATSSVEEVASTGPGIRFFQLYVYKDRNVVAQLVRRAERAGFKAIALTVDTPRLGRRESDIKNRISSVFFLPSLTLKNFEGLKAMDKTDDSGLASYVAGQIDRSLSWKDVKWLQTITTMPILVKGSLAIQAGAAGIIVSNHGARQLDYVPATSAASKRSAAKNLVVKAAQGRVPVFLDGGVRRGTDVFKALALGASGVFIGRPVVFSLAAAGEAGVRKVLQMLRDEFELTMALSGCCSLNNITATTSSPRGREPRHIQVINFRRDRRRPPPPRLSTFRGSSRISLNAWGVVLKKF
ncbi:unnamed protein product [Spirodela intermedia]|uniref:(S)-2-hydroxy-acid oxidase n=1 Tax=Spirodela intermedia TaxID=51605 RepID=A0A7I8JPP3_SPIIN|nr:unnamed protein product [Spirodela intermedia]CAA6671765.1 unnamed protein product [Spirodela intermedia]